jgi:hypothetical protein
VRHRTHAVRSCLITGLMLALSVLTHRAEAQSEGGRGGGMLAEPPKTVSIQFQGGTIADYVALLSEAADDAPVNVTLSQEAAEIELAPVTLRRVTLDQSLELLANTIDLGPTSRINVSRISGPPGGTSVYSINVQRAGVRAGPSPQSRLEVFSLRSLIQAPPGSEGPAFSVEEILTAVDTALELGGQGEADMRFHPESGLLIVRALPDQINAVDNIIGVLGDDVSDRRADVSVLTNQARALEHQLHKAKIEAEMQEHEVRVAQAQLERIALLAESGNVSSGELMASEAQMQRKRAEVELAQSEIRFIQQQLEQLHMQLDAEGETTWEHEGGQRSGPLRADRSLPR